MKTGWGFRVLPFTPFSECYAVIKIRRSKCVLATLTWLSTSGSPTLALPLLLDPPRLPLTASVTQARFVHSIPFRLTSNFCSGDQLGPLCVFHSPFPHFSFCCSSTCAEIEAKATATGPFRPTLPSLFCRRHHGGPEADYQGLPARCSPNYVSNKD